MRGYVPLKLLEALVDQIAARCATRAKTGTNSSEVFTKFAVETYEKERGLSNGCVPVCFARRAGSSSCVDNLPYVS